MSQDMAIGVVVLLAALLLVGRSVRWRWRGGEPLGRYALIWIAVFGLAFVIASMWRR